MAETIATLLDPIKSGPLTFPALTLPEQKGLLIYGKMLALVAGGQTDYSSLSGQDTLFGLAATALKGIPKQGLPAIKAYTYLRANAGIVTAPTMSNVKDALALIKRTIVRSDLEMEQAIAYLDAFQVVTTFSP